MPDMKTCRHDKGFRLRLFKAAKYKYPGLFFCMKGCGFYLNFFPGDYPHGLAYLPRPNPKLTKGKLQFSPPDGSKMKKG